jgi:hypothetical protein
MIHPRCQARINKGVRTRPDGSESLTPAGMPAIPVEKRARRLLVVVCGGLIILGMCGCIGMHRHQVGGEMLDDKVTNERVQAALKADSSNYYTGVEVNTTNGIVTLSGFVRTEEEKAKAVELAKTVRRVKELKDTLQVKP